MICERIAAGESVRAICESDGMPAKQTVLKWLSQQPSFAAQYARAKELGAEAIAEELFEIADDGRNDFVEYEISPGVTATRLDQEHIQRSRLRVDTRKWYLSKILPKKYGDKLTQEHTGPDGKELRVTIRSVLSAPPQRQIAAIETTTSCGSDIEHST